MSARESILASVRAALRDTPAPEPSAPAYRRHGDRDAASIVACFLDRLQDYNVHVTRLASQADIAAAVATRLSANGADAYVAPDDLPQAWRPLGLTAVVDPTDAPLSHDRLNATPSALTACALAIAETGTVVLDGASGQGRRALTLLVDHHICVVFADQLVDSVPDAIAALADAARAGRPITFFSGPSATADIEFERVVGVHGPRRLDVIFVAERPQCV
jgi:L-lactate dehydrogenase complex protein LldG